MGRTSLSGLADIKPASSQRVLDLVRAAGIDVSDWAHFAGGEKRAASNPKYCYEWSFVEPGRVVVLNLWHANMREQDGVVSTTLNLRKSVRGKGVWRRRAEKLDRAIQEAWKGRLPIRAVVNDGQMGDPDDRKAKASHVKHRLLDPMPWAVTSYDDVTGGSTLTRGALTGQFVDQFSMRPEMELAVERRMVSGMAFVRDPAVRCRALERAKGLCEYCANQGFATADGRIFLETHHIVPLSEGGADTEDNVAALCANHHREAHHGARAADIRVALLRQLGGLSGCPIG